MRFDAKRALALAETLTESRLPWLEAGRNAPRLIAGALAQAGCEVEQTEVSGSPVRRNARIASTWLLLGLALTLVILVHLKGDSRFGLRLAVLVSALLWLYLARELVRKVLARVLRDYHTRNVIGVRPASLNAPARVVFVTSLDAPPPVPRTNARRVTGSLFAVMIGYVVLVCVPGVAIPRSAALFALGIFEASLILWLMNRLRPFVGEGPADNRDGLACLVELAQSWSQRTDPRIETRFAAVGGQSLDAAGLASLVQTTWPGWPIKPTLVIGLWSPGMGQGLDIVSEGPEEIATVAAKGLWIPHRVRNGMTLAHDVWSPLIGSAHSAEFVGLIGDGRGEGTIDGGSLQRAAQLATEIALRWARTANNHDPVASRERSSQNPG